VAPPPLPLAGGIANPTLVALTLAAVVALSRLFTDPRRFFEPVAVVAVSVHVVAWWCRRARLGLGPAALLSAVTTVVVTSWVALGQTTAFGLPWRGTYHALGPALSQAAQAYRSSAAPTAVIAGFVVAGAIGAASAAFLGDWAAFRMRATTEACLPSFSLFVLSCALAQGHEVALAGGVWLGALLAFLLVRQAALDSPASAWFASRSHRGRGSLLAAGSLVGTVAVLVAVILGPHLPGATTHPMVDWRHQDTGNGGRTTASPLVDIRNRLHSESNQEVFTVKTTQPSYWRMTALDDFNGNGWSLDDTYGRVDSTLPEAGGGPTDLPPDTMRTTPVSSTFQVSALDSLWLPAAYRPQTITLHGVRVLYSTSADSLITSKATSDGTSYTVVSDVPAVAPAELNTSPLITSPDAAVAKYLQLPPLSPTIRSLALQHTQGAQTPYQMALMLQNWLRGPDFHYSLNVPADDGPNALEDFLTQSRAGFCQQFATAFAVLAREVGLPTRVAVGFTEGDLGSDGLYHVKDLDAHAWPEVWFENFGWIAFEPTPGRGSPDPNAEAITQVPPGQQSDGTSSSTTTVPAAAGSAHGPTTTAPATKPSPRFGSTTPGSASVHHGSSKLAWLGIGVAVLAAAVLAWALLLAGLGLAIRARRRRRARSPTAVVALAWTETGEAIAGAGAPQDPSETPAEYAGRAVRTLTLPVGAAVALHELAEIVEVTSYGPAEPEQDRAEAARSAGATVGRALTADRPVGRRALSLVDPRPLWRTLSAEINAGRWRWRRRTSAASGLVVDQAQRH